MAGDTYLELTALNNDLPLSHIYKNSNGSNNSTPSLAVGTASAMYFFDFQEQEAAPIWPGSCDLALTLLHFACRLVYLLRTASRLPVYLPVPRNMNYNIEQQAFKLSRAYYKCGWVLREVLAGQTRIDDSIHRWAPFMH